MWSNFISSANDEESTINNAFYSNDIFKISAEQEVKCLPRVQANTQNNKILTVIDTNIFILDNESDRECSMICCNSLIDCFTISSSENIILCGLDDGNLHGFSINEGIPLFNLIIQKDNIQQGRLFAGIFPCENYFYVGCTDGTVYRSSSIDELSTDYINETVKDDDTFCMNNTYLENITLEQVPQFKSPNGEIVTSMLILDVIQPPSASIKQETIKQKKYMELIVISATKNYLQFQHSNGNHVKINLPNNLNGIKNFIKLKNYILAISNSGHLYEICPSTYLMLHLSTNNEFPLIDDLRVLEDNDEQIELLILTKSNEQGSQKIKIINFPSLECTNEFPMEGNDIWLVSQSKNSVNLYYLMGGNYNEHNLPQEIEMKSILELDPKQRIKKLIYKGRLDEAEEFGKQFKLSLQPLYEVKAKKILTEINFMNNIINENLDKKFKEFLEILELIENKEFFVTIRDTCIPDRKIMNSYLKILLAHLGEGKTYEKDILDIKEQLLRLETLDILDPYETNLDWQKFVQQSNMLETCISYFKKDMLKACIIWKRHITCIIQHLDTNQILRLLNMIPCTIEPIRIIQWLQHFIPPISQIHSESLPLIVNWCIEKLRSLQYSNYWPDVGLEFIKDIKIIFENLNFLYSDIFRQYENCMEKLTELLNVLNELFTLKINYNVNLTLDNYIRESIDDTTLQILQRVQMNDLKKVINEFVYRIYLEKMNGEIPSNAIKSYIKYLVSRRRNISLWLERAIICIETLHCDDDKLKCFIMVLKASPVPWPDTIKPLLKLRNLYHPLANEISTEYELQHIKMIRIKYGWPVDAKENNMKLIFRIIKLNLSNMFDDLRNVIKLSPEIRNQANFYCCYELSRKGCIELAIKYFNELLNEKEKIECREKLLNIFARILDDDENDDEHIDSNNENRQEKLNIFEFLKIITSQSLNYDDQKFVKNLQNTQILREKYHQKLSYLDLNCEEKCKLIFKNSIMRSINSIKLQNFNNPIIKLWEITMELCKLLNLDKLYAFMEICKFLNNLQITCALIYHILETIEIENYKNPELFIDFAVLLITQHIIMNLNPKSNKDKIEQFDPLVYPLAYKLLCVALRYDKFHQTETVELLKWIQVGTNLYNLNITKEQYDNNEFINENIKKSLNDSIEFDGSSNDKSFAIESIFDHVLSPNTVAKPKTNPESVLKCISFGLLVIAFNLKPTNSVLNRFWKFIPEEYMKLSKEFKENFDKSLESIFRSKLYSCWYSICALFLEYQKNSSQIIIDKCFISHHLKRMFRHNLSQKEPNFIYLCVILLSESDPEQFLSELGCELRNEQQKNNYLILSEIYNASIQNLNNEILIRENRKKYYYYLELCKLNSERRCNNTEMIKCLSTKELINELRYYVLDVKLLEKMSKDFNWDHQELLVSQIITILNSQKLQFDVKIDAFGNEEIVMKSSVEEIYNLCTVYIDVITNLDLLASELLQFVPKINFYFYELYLCVIDILKSINKLPNTMELWSSILLFLKHKMIKKRRHHQNQLEIDYWLKLKQNSGILPKIARYRFPFLPLIENPLEEILEEEIIVDTCESWFPLIQLHNAHHGILIESQMIESQENFCIKAVKNSTMECWQMIKHAQNDGWHMIPVNNAFFQSVLRLIKHIKDLSKILFILYFVTRNAPNGIDQVQSSYECYKFAIENENLLSLNPKALEFIIKIKRIYPNSKIQHLLHIYNLIEDKLLQLIDNPKELIYAIYNHELILKSNSKKDLNKLAEEIAKLHNLKFDTIQLSLLQRWLSISSDQYEINDIDDTFCVIENDSLSSSLNLEHLNGNYDENIIRATYILRSWNPEEAIHFLISNIFPANESTTNTGKQLQNIECFIRLVNETTIKFTEFVSQKQYMILKCVHYLNQLGYNFNIEKFDGYDKLLILKKLWKNYALNSNALEIMVYICILYEIFIPQIWNGLFKQMIQLQMLKQLDALVEIISCKTSLLFSEGLALAWNYVLRSNFKNASRAYSNQQDNLLKTTLHRIQSCPLIGKLNLVEICEDCIRIDRVYIAAILIGLSSKEQREKITKIVKEHVNENLKKEILDLEENGILLSVINFVLKELNL